MVGLVMRYKCIGGFSDNMHGSVPRAWNDALGVGKYVECLASLFNHKFERYYSMYEQYQIFGSLKNLFSMIRQNGVMLPDNGKYKLNLPWNN